MYSYILRKFDNGWSDLFWSIFDLIIYLVHFCDSHLHDILCMREFELVEYSITTVPILS